jgi:hypothetical protein
MLWGAHNMSSLLVQAGLGIEPTTSTLPDQLIEEEPTDGSSSDSGGDAKSDAAPAAPAPSAPASVTPAPVAPAAPAPTDADKKAEEAKIEGQVNDLLAKLPASSGAFRDEKGNLRPFTTADLKSSLAIFFARVAAHSKLSDAKTSGDLKAALTIAGESRCISEPTTDESTNLDLVVRETDDCLKKRTQWEASNIPVLGMLYSLMTTDFQALGNTKAVFVPPAAGPLLPGLSPLLNQGFMVDGLRTLEGIFVEIHPEAVREYK